MLFDKFNLTSKVIMDLISITQRFMKRILNYFAEFLKYLKRIQETYESSIIVFAYILLFIDE